jgi:hypothetical protein
VKPFLSQLTLLAFLALYSIGHCETTNSFRIYLTDDLAVHRILREGKGDLSQLHLSEPPLISETDIISYDFSNHVITLKPEARARFPKSAPVYGNPFVVVADGQRVYLGGLTTCVSSISFGFPNIMVDRWYLVHNQPANILVIDRAYPSPSFAIGPDPRGDPRIKSALKALHKLKNDE